MKNKRWFLKLIGNAAMVAGLVMGCAFFAKMPVSSVHAMEKRDVALPVVSSVQEGAAKEPVYVQSAKLGDRVSGLPKEVSDQFTFELSEDSWVHFSGGYARNNHDGVGTDVKIYGDGSGREELACEFGYWRYKNECYGFLKKGRYYVDVHTAHENYDCFEGDANIYGYAIPVSKVLKVKKKVKKGITTVTFGDCLGSYGRGMQCIKGKVSRNSIYNRRVWKEYAASVKVWVNGGKKAKLLKHPGSGKFIYKVKKSGKYTFMIEDAKGDRYQKTVKIKVKR